MTVPLNMADGIRRFGATTPLAIAVRQDDRELTFAELDDRSSRLAQALLRSGLAVGTPVAVLSGNSMEYVEIAAALAKAGLPMVPLNPRNRVADNAYVLAHSGARALILQASLAGCVDGIVGDLDLILAFGAGGDECGRNYEALLADAEPIDPHVGVDEGSTFAIAYTSGTTGRAKGVLLTHRGRVLTAYATGLEYGLRPGRRTIAVAPMYLGAGLSFAFAGPQLGGCTTILPSWDPEQYLTLVQRDRIQTSFLVPTHLQQIRALTSEPCASYDLSALDTLFCNAAALPVALKEWAMAAFPGVDIHELYGSTEASVVTTLRPEDALRKAGSVGHPWFMTEVKLLDQDRQPVGPGEPGELFARSPMLMSGYLDNEEATRAATTEDGFLTVGDIAVADDEGFISIIDRKTDVIIAGGMNIYPREVEEVLLQLESVDECAVVGVPDQMYGERVAAFVVARRDRVIETAVLETHVRSAVASFKLPREWHVVDALPRNSAGKILKRELRDNSRSAPEEQR